MPQIFFATNRNVIAETSPDGSNLGDRFNQDRPQLYRVGKAEVHVSGDPRIDDNWRVGRTVLYPEDLDDTRPGGARLGSQQMFEELREHLRSDRSDLLIYIHGFAHDFAHTVRRAAALEQVYGAQDHRLTVVVFSWPSNGKVFPAWNYFSDREDAEASGVAMGRALARFAAYLREVRARDANALIDARRRGVAPEAEKLHQCGRGLHLVTHSMGAWALRHAVLKFDRENDGRLPRILDKVFLVAADEDDDALESRYKLGDLEMLANEVHVYHASNDLILALSDHTKGNPDRLGSDGPNNLDRVSERCFAVDCRDVSATELSHGRHQYYRFREEVIGDIRQTMEGVPQNARSGRLVIRPGRSWRLRPEG